MSFVVSTSEIGLEDAVFFNGLLPTTPEHAVDPQCAGGNRI
jgi:hypothetical protein